MIREMIAAKITDGAEYPDLVTAGFVAGHAFRCHGCDASYRLFYRSFGGTPTVIAQAAEITSFETCVENSHPAHPDRIWVKRVL